MHRFVFDVKKEGRVFPIPRFPPPPFSCCAVQTLEQALNSCRQAPGGDCAMFAVAVSPGPAGESLSFSNILVLRLPFVPPVHFLLYPPLLLVSRPFTQNNGFCSAVRVCGAQKQINKSARKDTSIHKQSVCTAHMHITRWEMEMKCKLWEERVNYKQIIITISRTATVECRRQAKQWPQGSLASLISSL